MSRLLRQFRDWLLKVIEILLKSNLEKHTSWNFLSHSEEKTQSIHESSRRLKIQSLTLISNCMTFFCGALKKIYFIECWQSNSFGDHWQFWNNSRWWHNFWGVSYPFTWKTDQKPSWFYHKPWANKYDHPNLHIWPTLMNNNVNYFCVQILANNKKGHLHAEILMIQQKRSIFKVNIL